jgi:hypothetical protein
VVCYTGEADGKYAGGMARWAQAGDYFTSLARWAAGPSGPLPHNMLLTQEVREGINVVRLHLDPERRGESFEALPRATTLRARPGLLPASSKAALRWSGADALTLEVPLEGGETALTTVEVPGYGPVALPPVCVPYSPEFKPAQGGRGLAALEKLGRATGGKERVELAGIWKDLPHKPRLVPVARWLLLAAVVLLLAEVLERRTGLLSRPRLLSLRGEREAAPARAKPVAPAVPAVRRARPVRRAAPAEEVRTVEPPAAPAPAPVKAEEPGGMVEALRQARERARGRTE